MCVRNREGSSKCAELKKELLERSKSHSEKKCACGGRPPIDRSKTFHHSDLPIRMLNFTEGEYPLYATVRTK